MSESNIQTIKSSRSTMIDDLKSDNQFRQIIGKFLKHKLAVAGLVFTLFLVVIAVVGPFITPYSPTEVTGNFAAPPNSENWLGTDQLGRDIVSRLIYATHISVIVGFGTVAVYVTFGTIIGLLSAYYGGWVDMMMMRITDMFMAFPFMVVILVVVSIVGPSLPSIIFVLALFSWPSIARLVRGSVLSIKQSDYIKAAVSLGYSTPRILFKHILPNATGPIIVNGTFGLAAAILTESGLSFLGLGVQPPTPTWGNMLTEAQSISVLSSQPWLWVPAGLMILLTVLAVNFVGDGLRDAFDPKQ